MNINDYQSLDHIVHELKLLNEELKEIYVEQERLSDAKANLVKIIKQNLGERDESKDQTAEVPKLKVGEWGRG